VSLKRAVEASFTPPWRKPLFLVQSLRTSGLAVENSADPLTHDTNSRTQPANPPDAEGRYGVGKIGFWSVVNGLTGMDMGKRCSEEWQKRLVKVKEKWKMRTIPA
jgi:hypothetical protein